MNLKKKFVIGAASVALVAGMGGVAAPAAVAAPSGLSLPGSIMKLERLGGLDRVQTSLAVAEKQFANRAAERLYIVSAAEGNMVDAATAGMLTDGPIAFVYNNSYVATAVGKFFTDAKFAGIKEVVAIGGDGVISDNTLNAVKDALKVKKSSRLAGKDRYATSVAIADYIYSEALKGNADYAGRVDDKGSYLKNAYLANGANEHVADSMVAGTLDNGAILLTQPDGKIPEVVAEFIKKALPTQFSALGGTGAVADATVNEAWVIKALGNKWETSYSIPNLRDKIDELEKLIKGAEGKTGTKMSDEATFGGLKFVVEKASANNQSWQNAVTNEKLQISNWFTKNRGKTSDDAFSVLETNLKNLFGPGIVTSDPKFFKLDANKKATGVDYDAITATQAYKDAVKAAEDELDRVWADKHQGTIANPIAVASQEHKTDVPAVTNQFAQIAEVAEYTLDNDKKWLDASEKQLASLKGEWRSEYDKIAPKTVQRFGGADRFETAQLIANWYAKGRHVSEAYIANGTRLADSLAAGQLMGGPILLVRNDTKIPEFTANVATHLLCWTDKTHPISVYGVGGTGVVSDDVLSTMVNLIGTKSVCEVKAPKAKTNMLTADEVYTTAGASTAVTTTAKIVGKSAVPTGLVIDAILNSAGTDVYTDNSTPATGKIYAAPAASGANPISVKAGANVAAGDYTVKFHDADSLKGEFIVHIATDAFTCTAINNAKLDDENTIAGTGTKPYAILSVTPQAKGKASDVTIVDSSKLKIAWTGAVDTYKVMLLDKDGKLGTCDITTVDPTLAVAAATNPFTAGKSETVAASYTSANVTADHAKPVITKVEVTPQAGAAAGKLKVAVNSLDSSKIDIASTADAQTNHKYDVKVTDNRGETKTITVTI